MFIHHVSVITQREFYYIRTAYMEIYTRYRYFTQKLRYKCPLYFKWRKYLYSNLYIKYKIMYKELLYVMWEQCEYVTFICDIQVAVEAILIQSNSCCSYAVVTPAGPTMAHMKQAQWEFHYIRTIPTATYIHIVSTSCGATLYM